MRLGISFQSARRPPTSTPMVEPMPKIRSSQGTKSEAMPETSVSSGEM